MELLLMLFWFVPGRPKGSTKNVPGFSNRCKVSLISCKNTVEFSGICIRTEKGGNRIAKKNRDILSAAVEF